MSDADLDEADGEDTFGNLLSVEELVEEDLCALEENTQCNTRPPLQVGQRVKVKPASARYAGEHWIGFAEEKTIGWKLITSIHGIIRRKMARGRRSKTIWQVQWFGPNVLRQRYNVDKLSRIYACHSDEYDRGVEKLYKTINK